MGLYNDVARQTCGVAGLRDIQAAQPTLILLSPPSYAQLEGLHMYTEFTSYRFVQWFPELFLDRISPLKRGFSDILCEAVAGLDSHGGSDGSSRSGGDVSNRVPRCPGLAGEECLILCVGTQDWTHRGICVRLQRIAQGLFRMGRLP